MRVLLGLHKVLHKVQFSRPVQCQFACCLAHTVHSPTCILY